MNPQCEPELEYTDADHSLAHGVGELNSRAGSKHGRTRTVTLSASQLGLSSSSPTVSRGQRSRMQPPFADVADVAVVGAVLGDEGAFELNAVSDKSSRAVASSPHAFSPAEKHRHRRRGSHGALMQYKRLTRV